MQPLEIIELRVSVVAYKLVVSVRISEKGADTGSFSRLSSDEASTLLG